MMQHQQHQQVEEAPQPLKHYTHTMSVVKHSKIRSKWAADDRKGVGVSARLHAWSGSGGKQGALGASSPKTNRRGLVAVSCSGSPRTGRGHRTTCRSMPLLTDEGVSAFRARARSKQRLPLAAPRRVVAKIPNDRTQQRMHGNWRKHTSWTETELYQ
jgi:hypothetical protein